MYPIPANATRIRYLESTRTQYIDTGVVPDGQTGIELYAWKPDMSGTSKDFYVLGLRDGSGDKRWCIGYSQSSKWYFGYGTFVASSTDGEPIRTSLNFLADGKFLVGTSYSYNLPSLSFSPTNQIRLFGSSGMTEDFSRTPIKIARCRISQGTSIVRDYAPVRVGQTGELFDRVTGTYATRVATLVCGPDTFATGVLPTRMMVAGVRKKEVWPVPLYTGVSLVGSSVQNNSGILSGFTGSSYATMPWRMTAGATSLEAVCRFTTRSIQSNVAQGIWGCVGSANAFTPFYLPAQSISTQFVNPVAYISSNGTSWNIETGALLSSSFKVNVGESCTIKCSFGPGGYTWSYWSNGTWVTAKTNSATAAPYGSSSLVPQLGTNRGQNNPLNGTIDLNYTYLMRDGELLWEGAPGAYKNVKTTYPD